MIKVTIFLPQQYVHKKRYTFTMIQQISTAYYNLTPTSVVKEILKILFQMTRVIFIM